MNCCKFITIALATNLPFSATAQQHQPDGTIGKFTQRNAADCFFLSSLIALSRDHHGREILKSSLSYSSNKRAWKITFPNLKTSPIFVTEGERKNYHLATLLGARSAKLASGDPDVQLLEIAADKVWKQVLHKPRGLCDDVSMNAFAMFTSSQQGLIWNSSTASHLAKKDLSKYKGKIKTSTVTTPKSATAALYSISKKSCIVLMDYSQYHAVCITNIDLDKKTYDYIDPAKGSRRLYTAKLSNLSKGIASGIYAINYLNLTSPREAATL